MNNFKYLIPLFTSVILVGCGGSATEATPKIKADAMTPVDKNTPALPAASSLSLSFTATKAFHFTWVAVPGATSYKLTEAVTSGAGYELIEETAATTTSFDHLVPLYARLNAKYILQSCNAIGCTASAPVLIDTGTKVADMVNSIGYFKASNTDANDYFGSSVSLSGDGTTLAVSAPFEDNSSGAIYMGPAGDMGADAGTASAAGAVYVFTRNDKTSAVWSQQAYLKASNAGADDEFGASVSISADGNTLVVGARNEDSTGAENSGAAYVFIRNGTTWTQQAQLGAINANKGANDLFGISVSLSPDGNTIAVGATGDDTGTASYAGAAYVFIRDTVAPNSVDAWSHQIHLTASNADSNDYFGHRVSLSANGNTLAVSANGEASDSGAAYVFIRDGSGAWTEQAYLKATNAGGGDNFGHSVSLSADGNTLAVSAIGEDSIAKGINNTGDDVATDAGAVYVFIRNIADRDSTAAWSQQAYLKASNTELGDKFGRSVSISADGDTLAVSTYDEASNANGIGGDQGNVILFAGTGAVYTFTRSGTTWSQQAYIKAKNSVGGDYFGASVALSSDSGTLAVGASEEKSPAKGINADHAQGSRIADAGAVYVY